MILQCVNCQSPVVSRHWHSATGNEWFKKKPGFLGKGNRPFQEKAGFPFLFEFEGSAKKPGFFGKEIGPFGKKAGFPFLFEFEGSAKKPGFFREGNRPVREKSRVSFPELLDRFIPHDQLLTRMNDRVISNIVQLHQFPHT